MLLNTYNDVFVMLIRYDGQVYWPKREDIDRILKVECTPMLGETEYLPVYAISSPVSPGIFLTSTLKCAANPHHSLNLSFDVINDCFVVTGAVFW